MSRKEDAWGRYRAAADVKHEAEAALAWAVEARQQAQDCTVVAFQSYKALGGAHEQIAEKKEDEWRSGEISLTQISTQHSNDGLISVRLVDDDGRLLFDAYITPEAYAAFALRHTVVDCRYQQGRKNT